MEVRYAICYSANIPLRRTPEDGAEMMTELIFGDACKVFEEKGTWCRIVNKSDGYEGWLTKKMLTFVEKEEYDRYDPLAQPAVASYIAETVEVGGSEHLLLTGGSALPYYDCLDSTFQVAGRRFYIRPECLDTRGMTIAGTACQFINSPYLWGGKNALGIDCSGLTQVVFRIHGIQLLRDARDQVAHGESVSLENAVAGDLAFFANAEGRIVHVGIILGGGRIIHASGSVHIDRIDGKGIYSEALGKYTHSLHSVRHIDVACRDGKQ